MKSAGITLAVIGGLYLIGRAVAEPFVIDLTDPASYRNDWGGPSLIGVLAVHCLPGILSLAAMVFAIRRRPSPHNRLDRDHNGQLDHGGGRDHNGQRDRGGKRDHDGRRDHGGGQDHSGQ